MRYVKPQYYDSFVCSADQCPASCCQGWQIVIDEESLNSYWNEKGDFGNRLKNSIDWESGTFCQYKGRCEFLNERNLCDIQEMLGENGLCDTCRNYPRHVEEFEGVREYSLSLSCPEAAKIMITDQKYVELVEWETDEEEEFEEGFDFLFYTQLLDARKILWNIMQDREEDMRIRLEACLLFARKMQKCLEKEAYSCVDEWLRIHENDFRRDYELAKRQWKEKKNNQWIIRKREITLLKSLEWLDPSWGKVLTEADSLLYQSGKDKYNQLYLEFQNQCGYDSVFQNDWSIMAEQIGIFFLYTYFCGAVYDWEVETKIRLMVFSVEWIQELTMYVWYKNGKRMVMNDAITIAYRFAREIEHSDQNLLQVEEWLNEMNKENRLGN